MRPSVLLLIDLWAAVLAMILGGCVIPPPTPAPIGDMVPEWGVPEDLPVVQVADVAPYVEPTTPDPIIMPYPLPDLDQPYKQDGRWHIRRDGRDYVWNGSAYEPSDGKGPSILPVGK